jgi:hypothetical protein
MEKFSRWIFLLFQIVVFVLYSTFEYIFDNISVTQLLVALLL